MEERMRNEERKEGPTGNSCWGCIYREGGGDQEKTEEQRVA